SDACTFAMTVESAPNDCKRLIIELTCTLERPEPPLVDGVEGVEGVLLWLEPPPPPPPPPEWLLWPPVPAIAELIVTIEDVLPAVSHAIALIVSELSTAIAPEYSVPLEHVGSAGLPEPAL